MTDVDRGTGDPIGVDDLLESTEDERTVRRRRRWRRVAVQTSLAMLALLVFGLIMWRIAIRAMTRKLID